MPPANPGCENIARRSSETLVVVTQAALIAGLMLAAVVGADSARADTLKIERIAITVTDLGRTEAFYRDGLGFRTVASNHSMIPRRNVCSASKRPPIR